MRGKPRKSPGGNGTGGSAGVDFAQRPAYRCALRLYGLVFDLEPKIPDDERPTLYHGMKRAAMEVGAFLAAGFGRLDREGARDPWERARSSLMESRHYVLLAQSRYLLDTLDVEAFDSIYNEALEAITALLDGGADG